MADTVLLSTWEMTRNLPPLAEMVTDGSTREDGTMIWRWVDSGIEVDFDELIRLGYYKEVPVCPTCKGVGHLEE